jgi:hypothetical protein
VGALLISVFGEEPLAVGAEREGVCVGRFTGWFVGSFIHRDWFPLGMDSGGWHSED